MIYLKISDLREIWDLREGDRISFNVDDEGKVTGEPRLSRSIRDVVGIIKTDMKYDEDKVKQALENHFADRKDDVE